WRDSAVWLQLQQLVQRGPAHHLGKSVGARRSATLPNATVRRAPLAADDATDPGQHAGFRRLEAIAACDDRVRRGDDLAIDVELALPVGAVADAHLRRCAVARGV